MMSDLVLTIIASCVLIYLILMFVDMNMIKQKYLKYGVKVSDIRKAMFGPECQ